LASWIVLLALWLLLVTVSVSELLAGVVAAAIAATAVEVVHAQGLVRFDPDPRWLLRIWKLPRGIVRDCWLLSVALVRHLTGRSVNSGFRAIPFHSGGDDARSSARRALVVPALSVSPNTYVIGIDEESDLMLVHQLIPSPREETEEKVLGDL
jgi:multisubunit Na+/H+ antiporter MnhE subunit